MPALFFCLLETVKNFKVTRVIILQEVRIQETAYRTAHDIHVVALVDGHDIPDSALYIALGVIVVDIGLVARVKS